MAEISNKEKIKPLVSIVVPVYNVEDTLRECLISVVFQTLPDIEVIIVNDASPDHSQEIIDEFVTAFPDKVIAVQHEVNQGLAMARRTGLHHASAPYVLFVDSDDFVSGRIAERLYEKIVEDDLDILYYPFLQVDVSTKKVERKYPSYKGNIQKHLIRFGASGFQFAMYRTAFLKKNESCAFIKGFFEDAAATPLLISKTDKIGLFKKCELYYYRINRTGSITTSAMTEQKTLDYQAADLTGWDKMPEELKESYAFRTLKRAVMSIRKYPEIYDYTISHVKALTHITDEYNPKLPSSAEAYVRMAKEKPEEVIIPKIVYINGFMKNDLYDYEAYVDEGEKAYLFNPQVIILDSEHCDMSELPKAIREAGNEEIGIYLALKTIYEQGGIYLGPQVKVTTSFNREAYNQAFFVAGSDYQVLPCVFAAAPGHPVIQSMLQKIADSSELSISESMSRVLINLFGAHLDGEEQMCIHDTHILPVYSVNYSGNISNNYCVLNYNNLRISPEGMLTVPIKLCELSWRKKAESEQKSQKSKKVSSNVEDELNRIKSSRAWGMVTKIYEYRDWLKNKTLPIRRLARSIRKKN